MTKSEFDFILKSLCIKYNVKVKPEHKFLDDRYFKFDYAFINAKIALEYEGGIWTNGAHTRGEKYSTDREKYNLAQLEGWEVYSFVNREPTKKYNQLTFLEKVIKKVSQIEACINKSDI